MQITEEILRKRFSRNLSTFRKSLGMTQLELAEKLNYSDKSVSKWERGDGLPDLAVSAYLAEILGVTINDLIDEKPKKILLTRNKLIITLLSIGVAWLVATVMFVLFAIILPDFKSWLFYIYAIPVSAIVAIVFSYIWWGKIPRFLSVSLLIWSIPICIMVTLPVARMSLIFIIAAVMQILTILWFLIKKNK